MLVDYLINKGVLKSPQIIDAFANVDRKDFLPDDVKPYALNDHPLPIGFGQTNSQPSTVAFMLELLNPSKNHKVLDVGAGSGWTTALLAHIVGPNGLVVATERIPELVTFAKNNLSKYGFNNIILEQARTLGCPEHQPYDRILVSAAADKIPEELLAQLSPKGIMVIPVKDAVIRIGPDGKKIYDGFRFVPLVY